MGRKAKKVTEAPTTATLHAVPKLPNKAPARFELVMTPDDSGLALKEVTGVFVFRFPGDQYAGGADRQKMNLDTDTMTSLRAFFQECIQSFIKKHGCCSIEDALELLAAQKPKEPAVSVQ